MPGSRIVSGMPIVLGEAVAGEGFAVRNGAGRSDASCAIPVLARGPAHQDYFKPVDIACRQIT